MKLRKSKYLLAALLMATSIGATACSQKQDAKPEAKQEEAKPAEVQAMKGEDLAKIEADKKEKEKYLVVDVRSAEEYKAGHVKFAINMPIDTFEKEYKKIDSFKDKDVVLYCNSGKKSGKAAEILVNNGFTKVYNAEGVKQYKYELVTFASLMGADFEKDITDGKAKVVIDARDEADFKEKTFKGALNINPDTFEASKDKLPSDKNDTIYVFCYSGNKSAKVAEMLTKLGYKNVVNALDGSKEYAFKF